MYFRDSYCFLECWRQRRYKTIQRRHQLQEDWTLEENMQGCCNSSQKFRQLRIGGNCCWLLRLRVLAKLQQVIPPHHRVWVGRDWKNRHLCWGVRAAGKRSQTTDHVAFSWAGYSTTHWKVDKRLYLMQKIIWAVDLSQQEPTWAPRWAAELNFVLTWTVCKEVISHKKNRRIFPSHMSTKWYSRKSTDILKFHCAFALAYMLLAE